MSGKAVISLTTGLEDPEKVTVAFLVAVAAAEQQRRSVVPWLGEGEITLTRPGDQDACAAELVDEALSDAVGHHSHLR